VVDKLIFLFFLWRIEKRTSPVKRSLEDKSGWWTREGVQGDHGIVKGGDPYQSKNRYPTNGFGLKLPVLNQTGGLV
jgi:hypothetical protein